ncbi:MAG: NAD-dependent epimerase/dehydratase family protein [Verrucomicrobia bacterium]|jgi:dTDP-glucose 4,6-dehydratase|nr:NAD-dependent epimerase/dehydratase family protein [Verrucomicrobiota bacterium]
MSNPVAQALPAVYAEDFAALAERVPVGALQRSEWVITGATGMIPSWLCHFLGWLNLEGGLGLRLRLVGRKADTIRRRFPWLEETRGRGHCLHQLNNGRLPAGIAATADFLLHAASPATPKACAADPAGLFCANTLLSADLLGQADPATLRAALFFSSSEVYGEAPPQSPRNLYPLAKRSGEALFFHYARTRSLPVRIARIFHTYGPGMDLDGDDRVFAELVRNALRGEALHLKSEGTGRRSFAYIADTVAGILLLLLKGSPGMTADVGNAAGVLQISELAQLLARLAPGGPLSVHVRPDPARTESPAPDRIPDTRDLASLGWDPRVSPEDGFRRTLQSYR